MDVYQQVKERARSHETLYAQAAALIESMFHDFLAYLHRDSASGHDAHRYDFFWLEKVASALEHPQGVNVAFAEDVDDPFAENDVKDAELQLINMDMLIEMGCPAHKAGMLLAKAGAQCCTVEEVDEGYCCQG